MTKAEQARVASWRLRILQHAEGVVEQEAPGGLVLSNQASAVRPININVSKIRVCWPKENRYDLPRHLPVV
jgi:hypothetical protein